MSGRIDFVKSLDARGSPEAPRTRRTSATSASIDRCTPALRAAAQRPRRARPSMAEQVKAADAPAPALSFGNFADKVASPSGGFNFKAPEFNTGNQGLFGAPTKFGETADKKEGADPRHEFIWRRRRGRAGSVEI